MRARGKPTRLELHRLRYNQAGRRGPLLTIWDLDNVEKNLVQAEILQDVRVMRIDFTGDMDEQIWDGVQAEVFAEWGIMCPHPDSSREDADLPGTERCKVCGSVLFPRHRPAQAAAQRSKK